MPLLSAWLLGLMTAISPCPLATNITETAYLSRNFENRRTVLLSGVLYSLGRAFSYVAIGAIVYAGVSKFEVARLFQQYGERLLIPLLILTGLMMLGVLPLGWLGAGRLTERWSERFKHQGLLGATLLGAIFALVFCPYSGALYFGMLMPLTLSQPAGLWLPFVFALGTGLPVLLFAYLVAFSFGQVGRYFRVVQRLEKGMRYVAGSVFVLTGLYYWLIFAQVL